MRKVGALNMSNLSHEEERRIEKKRRPRRRSYVCSYCKYESTRQYNVMRHETRIHSTNKKPRTCCNLVLPTKGEYYLHCEHFHPERRSNAVVSRSKYKILADMMRITSSSGHLNRQKRRRSKRRRRITFDDETEDEDEEEENERKVEEKRTYVLRRKCSERMREKGMETRTKSELTFQCSITYSELDRENIPLACFLNDRGLRKARYSSTPEATVNPPTKAAICKDATQSTKKHDDPRESISDTSNMENTTIPQERSREKKEERQCSRNEEEEGECSRNEEEGDTSSVLESSDSFRRWTSLSESSSSSFVGELPTKKLILRRFMTTMNIEIENTSQQRTTTMPLQERNSNVIVPPQSKRSVKRCKRSFVSSSSSYTVMDKENIPNLELEEKVKVELDNGIDLPFVTALHREFLSSIDFDSL